MSGSRFLRRAGGPFALLVSTLFCLVVLELLLRHRVIPVAPLDAQGRVDMRQAAREAARRRGEPFDERSAHEVIQTARRLGRRAFPAVSPAYFLAETGSTLKIGGDPVLPLGIAARADNYYCNESGRFANFVTDRFGFRNPDAIWDGAAEMVVVGDSFTMGSCLDEESSLVGQLRQSGRQVVNLGMGANGPLLELASLIEYGGAARPKTILWIFFANDFEDLERESRNPILRSYLTAGFSQRLIERRTEIDPAIDAAIEEHWKRIEAAEAVKDAGGPPAFFTLPELRRVFLHLKAQAISRQTAVAKPDMPLLMQILRRAHDEANRMGARLHFVYIPDCLDRSYGQDRWKQALMTSVRAPGVGVVDTETAISSLTGKTTSGGYFYCPGSHLNEAGATAAASAILEALARDH